MRGALAGSLTPSFVLGPIPIARTGGKTRRPTPSCRSRKFRETKQFTRTADPAPDSGRPTADRMRLKAGDNLQRRGRPRGCPQQLGLGDADERREVHVLMSELNELHAPFLALESVSENV